MKEIKEAVEHIDNVDQLKHTHVEEVVVNRITEDDVMKLSRESLNFWSGTGFRICLIMFVQGCNQAGYGVDWAVIGGINAFDSLHQFFGFGTSGGTFGLINALMNIGQVCGAPFLALNDVIGRRGVNFVGNFLVLVAALLQGLAPNLAALMGGRFLLGFGSALMSNPQYMAEVAPVHLRGRLVGIFGACFQIGSVGMNAAMIGLSTITTSNWGWRIPLLLEGLFPLIVCSTIYFITPESPRYLVQKGKVEKAKEVIARYQTTSGRTDEPIVGVVLTQIEESLETSRTNFRSSWDFRVFFTKIMSYRLAMLVIYSCFQSWNGGGIIGYYLTPALQTIGVTRAIDQLGIQLGLTAIYFVFTVLGSFLIDIFKRRTLIFVGIIGIVLMQTAATITSWQYSLHESKAESALVITWMFCFQIISATFIATMHNLYPIEILALPVRAKGMGLYGLIQGAANAVQSYGISVGIAAVGYKIWVVYIVYNTLQFFIAYFVFPETSKLSLEEIDAVFETPGVHPVKMGKLIQKAKKERAAIETTETE